MILPTDTDGVLFLPLIPMMGHYSSHTDTNDGAPSLVSVGGIVPHHWLSVGRIMPHHWVSRRNRAPSLVSVGGIVPHHWCQWEESCPIIGVRGGIVPHHWCQWEE
ncbi:unnamed protein product [Staurois parvus]|uniref:Uncharacterized protein n=1 Tax=Staurois parvus TaxID=386267 RepID=A0ABN9ECQ2_9NEOB|nr:unnamed protein product [Staurois parvus]